MIPRYHNGITILADGLPVSPGKEAIYPYLRLRVPVIYLYPYTKMVYPKVSTNSQNFRQNVQISYHSVNLLSGNEGVKFSEQGHQCFFLSVARFQRSHRYTDGISECSFILIFGVPISYPISLVSGWLDPGNEVVFFRVSDFSYLSNNCSVS